MQMRKHRGKPFTPRLFSLLMPVLLGAFSLQAAAVASPSPQTSPADEQRVFTPLAAPVDLAARAAGNSVALLEVRAAKHTRSVTVMFDHIRLSPGAYLQVFSADKKTLYSYNAADFYTADGARGFESDVIPGEMAVVRVVYPLGSPSAEDRLQVTGYRTADPKQARVVIGSDQRKQAVCYKTLNEEIWQHSEAVARVNGATGWNVAGGPYLMTNHHVAGDVGKKQHRVLYNYASTFCDREKEDTANTLSINTRRVVAAGKGPGSPAPGNKDWAMYQLDELAWEEAGVVPFFGALTLDTDSSPAQLKDHPLYVVQHPGWRARLIASTEDDGNTCRVTSANTDSVYHNCDTSGGSSGSPVLSQRTHAVVAEHYGGAADWNVGVNSRVVYNGIAGILPGANQPAAGSTGKGKVKVATVSLAPALPSVIDGEVSEAVELLALDARRLRQQDHGYQFIAKGRAADGTVSDINVRLHPLKEQPGALSLTVSPEENSGLKEGILNGWMAFSLNSEQDGHNVRNLILPFSYEYYDPFVSPFAAGVQVQKLVLTDEQPALSKAIQHSTNFGFLTVRNGQGPVTLQSGGTGYTPLQVQVKDEQGQIQVAHLRGQRKTSCQPALRPMNSMTGCGSGGKPASLQVSYSADDNPQLPGGHYSGLLPVIASRDAFSQPLLVEIDLTVAPDEGENPDPQPDPEPGNYDHVFPQELKQYHAGSKVLQPKTGKVYQCKPFPWGGYCSQWSAGSNAYEPGVGFAWQQAWTEVK